MREVGEAGLRAALAAYVHDQPRVVVAGNHATPTIRQKSHSTFALGG